MDGKLMSNTPSAPPPAPEHRSHSSDGYRTTPDHENTGWPPGVPYIIGNEACERFSYYGMKAILYAHLVTLYVLAGAVADVAKAHATETTHLFFAGVYALPMIGAIVADRLAGKYRTILYLSLVYCAGHAVLSLFENSLTGMYVGLGLIAVGSGGIKPCVSANVGDQFGKANWFRVRTVYQIFYFSINFGSFFSTLLIPLTKKNAGYWAESWFPSITAGLAGEERAEYLARLGTSIAFGIPGVLMFIATIIFWMGRRKFVHIPARPGGQIGLLDTLSSACLFMAVGHLFFTPTLVELVFGETPNAWARWGTLGFFSASFLALGVMLFARRQRLQPDDGFLAIVFFTLGEWFGGRSRSATGAAAGGDSPLARSRFWGPAVDRYGVTATEGPIAVFKIISVFFLVSVFWALFDQHSSTWIEQARQMDLRLWGREEPLVLSLLGWELSLESITLLPTQIPALNPLMVMLLIPFMNLVYRGSDRMGLKTTPLRRITVGMLLAAAAFAVVALLQARIDSAGPGQVWVGWQIIPYLIMTVAEVMVSITGLEFAYTQAPKRMKSTVMGFWLLTVSLGNVLVALLAGFKGMSPADFFWTFAGLMAGAGVLFGLRATFYVPRDYTQE
jgi:POT family proton-dependent oligopeptide transporter